MRGGMAITMATITMVATLVVNHRVCSKVATSDTETAIASITGTGARSKIRDNLIQIKTTEEEVMDTRAVDRTSKGTK